MVTHDMSIAEHADRIYKMDNGVISVLKDRYGYIKSAMEN